MLPLITLARKAFVVVPADRAFVVERLGAFHAVLHSGLHVVVPFIDRIAREFSTEVEKVLVPEQRCFSLDGQSLGISGEVFIRVTDPRKATYDVSDPSFATLLALQDRLLREAPHHAAKNLIDRPAGLAEGLREQLANIALPWGIEVLGVNLSVRLASDVRA
jgi:regulator of protease activity HflC (stomatin/prohibitin superfamily)